MKKYLWYVIAIMISLIITFVLFEQMSWYHFGDALTRVVAIRLTSCFLLLAGISVSVIAFIYKKRK